MNELHNPAADPESQSDSIEQTNISTTLRRVMLLLLCILLPCIGLPVAFLQERDQKWRFRDLLSSNATYLTYFHVCRLTRDGILHRWTRSRALHWCTDWKAAPEAPTKIRVIEPFTLDGMRLLSVLVLWVFMQRLADYSNLCLAVEGGTRVLIPLPPESAPVILDRWNTWRGMGTPGL